MYSPPQLRPDHLLRLSDDVGIIQHATGVIPNRSSGYCVDDVARLAIVMVGLERERGDPPDRRVLAGGLSFLFHAWERQVPGMHNFMDYDRRWLDAPHSGDHVGRAAWALGAVIAAEPAGGDAAACRALLADMTPCLRELKSPRGVAFTILGLTRPDIRDLAPQSARLLTGLADDLAGWFDRHQQPAWPWFEDALTYDNARLPQALIAAGSQLGDPGLTRRGLAALDWYADQCGIHTDTIRLVGNRWRQLGQPTRSHPDAGDEQPLDAAALVEALLEASMSTGDRTYADQARYAFQWFLGRNTYRLEVYDSASGGCRDGVGPGGLNENQGAESTLVFLQALLAITGADLGRLVGSPA